MFLMAGCSATDLDDTGNGGQNGTDTPSEQEIVFPEKVVRNDVKAGEVLEMTFKPELDWKVSVPRETMNWFWIDADGKKDFQVRGKAGAEYQLKVVVSDKEEFSESRSCTVTMEMGGKTAVIAEYVRPALSRELSIYNVIEEDGQFKLNPEGTGYEFSEQEAQRADMVWTSGSNGFRTHIRVKANSPWVIEHPEWIDIKGITDGFMETVDLSFIGVNSKYPIDGAEDKISFYVLDGETKGELIKEIPIAIPSCRDRLDINSSALSETAELIFSHDGLFFSKAGYVNEPYEMGYYATELSKPIAVEVVDGTIGAEAGWVKLDISEWNKAADADVLQDRTVTISVEQNQGVAREAKIIFVPSSLAGKDLVEAGIITADKKTVNEGFFSCPLKQEAYVAPEEQEFIKMMSSNDQLAVDGAKFEISDPTAPEFSGFGEFEHAYTFTYTKEWSNSNAYFDIMGEFNNYVILDNAMHQQSADFWITMEKSEDNLYLISMAPDAEDPKAAREGYIKFMSKPDILGRQTVIAVVHCVYDPSKEIVPGQDGSVRFTEDSLPNVGFTGTSLTQITEGALYDEYKEYNCPIYMLEYKSDMIPMSLYIPAGCNMYTVNPYSKSSQFRVNDLDYNESAGRFDLSIGFVTIYMSLDPETPEVMTNEATILFMGGDDMSGSTYKLVLLCRLDMSEQLM